MFIEFVEFYCFSSASYLCIVFYSLRCVLEDFHNFIGVALFTYFHDSLLVVSDVHYFLLGLICVHRFHVFSLTFIARYGFSSICILASSDFIDLYLKCV